MGLIAFQIAGIFFKKFELEKSTNSGTNNFGQKNWRRQKNHFSKSPESGLKRLLNNPKVESRVGEMQ